MNKKVITGTEWCAFCETETDFDVDEETWVIKCPHCGRPLPLCDKCHRWSDNSSCANCPHEKEFDDAVSKWEEEQIGKTVVYSTGNEYDKEIVCKIVGFKDHLNYILKPVNELDGGEFTAWCSSDVFGS